MVCPTVHITVYMEEYIVGRDGHGITWGCTTRGLRSQPSPGGIRSCECAITGYTHHSIIAVDTCSRAAYTRRTKERVIVFASSSMKRGGVKERHERKSGGLCKSGLSVIDLQTAFMRFALFAISPSIW